MINLDSHVIKKPSPRVTQLMQEKWGLLEVPHRKGIELYPAVDEAVHFILTSLEAEGYSLQVTPGGFFAMQHLFMHFYLQEVRQTGRNHFLSSILEEAPILKALDCMEMMGCGVKLLPVDSSGRIDLSALEASLGVKAGLVSISAVCAMTGVIQPIPEIVQICHAKGVKVHVNVSHAIGTWGVSLKEWPVDYLSWDGDKIGTPSGLGALLSKESMGENFNGLLPLKEAFQEVIVGQEAFAMETARLRAEFEEELCRIIPDCKILGKEVDRVPHIFAVSFPGLMNEALLYELYRHGIEASIGGGQFQTLTHITKQWGLSEELSLGSTSFALGEKCDLAHVVDVIVRSVRKLKKMSVRL